MTHHAQIDVEWGGENVYVRTNTDAIQVQAFLTDTDADTMRTQLGWAVGEVRRFRQHLANGGRAALFHGQPKPAEAPAQPDPAIPAAAVQHLMGVVSASRVQNWSNDKLRFEFANLLASWSAPVSGLDTAASAETGGAA